MKTIPLGNTGEQVSALCLGTMYYGTRVNQEMSYQLLDQYMEAGGTFLDTANIYAHWVEGFSGGESETLLGLWLKQRKNRDKVFLASKVGFGYGLVQTGLTARQIAAECEKSLRRLGVDTIDLYYAHVDDRYTPLEETLESFNLLVKEGKVRYIGASNYRAWRLEQARCISQTRSLPQYCCIQQRYTYLQPRTEASFAPQVAANEDLLDYCREQGTTLLAYSPLLGGAYTQDQKSIDVKYLNTDNQKRLETLREVAGELNASTNQVILAWMLAGSPTVVPVFSASNPEQLAEDLGALQLNLSPAQMERLNKADLVNTSPIHPSRGMPRRPSRFR